MTARKWWSHTWDEDTKAFVWFVTAAVILVLFIVAAGMQ
jgi:hypothetical protein